MPVTVNGSVLTQTDATSASPSTLTFTSTVLTGGDVVVIAVAENNVAEFVTPAAPTGGTGLSWTQIINQQNTAAHFSECWAYWTKVPSDQTSTITVTTTSTSNLGTMATLWRLSGVDQVTSIGLTDGFQGQTDPTGTDLQLVGTLAGSLIVMAASDWSAGTAARTITISGTTGGVTDFDNLESGQFRGIFARAIQSSSTNQGTLDYSAATGDWAAIIFEVKAAAVGGFFPIRSRRPSGTRRRFRQYQPTLRPLFMVETAAGIPDQLLAVTGIDTDEIFGAVTVTPGTAAITAAGISGVEAVGAVTLTQTITASGITSAEAVGAAAAGQGLVATGISSAEQSGAITVTATATITATGISSAERLGSAAVGLSLAATGVTSSEASGQSALGQGLVASGIGSAERLGAAVATPGTVAVTATGISSGEAIGAAQVSLGATQNLTATGISGVERSGAHAVTASATIAPAGISSTESVGAVVATPGAVTLAAVGIGSLAALGQAAAAAQLVLAGIGSFERSGQSVLTAFAPTAVPKAGQIEPGTRTFAGVEPGLRAGAGAEPGTRGAASIVTGIKRGAQAEPGTRTSPNVEGGA